jgi:predicted lipoprotein with Yx(FWY)xxD motif
MKRTATAATWSAAALLLTAAISGCSSGGKDASSTAPSASSGASAVADTSGGGGYGSSSPSTSAAATVSTKSAGKLGTILVDAKGRTLYLFKADTKKNKSTCSGACATAWPPLLTKGAAKTTQHAKKNLLGTAKRSGGTQVTYNGHPLYLYAGDAKPGQTNGQGLNQFGALWYVLTPAGKQITTQTAAH